MFNTYFNFSILLFYRLDLFYMFDVWFVSETPCTLETTLGYDSAAFNEIEFSSALSVASAVRSMECENPREASLIQKNSFRRVTNVGSVPSRKSIDPQNQSSTQGVQNLQSIISPSNQKINFFRNKNVAE